MISIFRTLLAKRFDRELSQMIQTLFGFEIVVLLRRSKDISRPPDLTPIHAIGFFGDGDAVLARHQFISPITLASGDELRVLWHTTADKLRGGSPPME